MLDAISAAYIAWGAWRGHVNGVAREGFRLFRLGIALAAGRSLFGLVRDGLGEALALGADVSGPLGFVAIMGCTWYLLSNLRRMVESWLGTRFSQHAAMVGAVAGGLRASLIVITIVGIAGLTRGVGALSESFVGRVATWLEQ
ncbi:MAG: hypothetical protein NZ740_10270 [Kiritimatiellae bacterium]|nr:hypothetical protein [Kiritimatiellia bacterium]MDW8459473.1 hypothetical protein [Verrucomicrobiota bacterium]